jgi:hypothetical protein
VRHHVVSVLFAVAVCALALAAPAQSAFPGANGRIAFAAAGCTESVNPDGTDRRPATQSCQLPQVASSWGPDGRRLAYATGFSIYYVTDGANPVEAANGEEAMNSAGWSPDGSQLVTADAYCEGSNTNCSAWLFTVNLNGGGGTTLQSVSSNVRFRPAGWSPDGTRIAFVDPNLDLRTIKPDGTDVTLIAANVTAADWSPDGSKFVFVRGGEVWRMNRDGSAQVRLTNDTNNIYYDNRYAVWSPDGKKLAVERHVNADGSTDIFTMDADGTSQTDITNTPAVDEHLPTWQPIPLNYARPRGASPFQTYLVPAYKPCTAPNRTHGSPLAFPSCSPPTQASDYLTLGTPDSNGAGANGRASVFYAARTGDAGLEIAISDIRNKADLSDYTGEVQVVSDLRITDRNNTPYPGGPGPGTAQDAPLRTTVACTATAETTIGSACNLTTTVNAVYPGALTAGQRSIWQLGQVHAYDGGADGDAETTADNTLFMDQGLFVP